MNTNHAQLHIQSPALTSTAIFWVFILLSLFAHGVFLMINSGDTSKPELAQVKPSIEITLQQQQAQPALAPEEIKPEKKAYQTTSKELARVDIRRQQTKAQQTITPQVNAVLLRHDALQWLQQQANSQYDDNAQLRQIVAYGPHHRDNNDTYSAYRSQDGSVKVAFQIGSSNLCASIREADPLDSFDQGAWMMNSNCQG